MIVVFDRWAIVGLSAGFMSYTTQEPLHPWKFMHNTGNVNNESSDTWAAVLQYVKGAMTFIQSQITAGPWRAALELLRNMAGNEFDTSSSTQGPGGRGRLDKTLK